MNNPSYYAWLSRESPDVLQKYGKYVLDGQCSLCGLHGQTVHVKRIASFLFSNWEDYSNITKPAWCKSCAWSFNDGNNRSEALMITKDTVYSCYQVQSLKPLLAKPLDATTSISVALKKHKHVLPYATWNTIRIEDINLPWTAKEVELSSKVSTLVSLGFAIGHIRNEPSPPVATLLQLNREEIQLAYILWESLDYLKTQPQLFDFMISINKKVTMDYASKDIPKNVS